VGIPRGSFSTALFEQEFCNRREINHWSKDKANIALNFELDKVINFSFIVGISAHKL
jgi:hypothetical protein